ncbi:unnamed protein product, partial [Chrysoparadoxa australica]
MYTQASPGVGKTVIFQELWRRDEKDINRLSEPIRSWAQDATVYGIEFYGKMPLDDDEYEVATQSQSSLTKVVVSLRMIYSEFVLGGEVTWGKFVTAV